MLKIDSTTQGITLTRGDSAELQLSIKDADNNDYDFSNDTVKFGVKRSALDTTPAMLVKEFDENGKIYFDPDDTKSMQFGDYLYDVTVYHTETDAEENEVTTVCTVINAARFTLAWNVL